MGTTLRTIVYDIGGGVPGSRKFKAVQIGGPLGPVFPIPFSIRRSILTLSMRREP